MLIEILYFNLIWIILNLALKIKAEDVKVNLSNVW